MYVVAHQYWWNLMRNLLGFLKVYSGVINIHVGRRITKALIENNPTMVPLNNFDMGLSIHRFTKEWAMKSQLAQHQDHLSRTAYTQKDCRS